MGVRDEREREGKRQEKREKETPGLLSHVRDTYAASVRVKSVLSHGHACARYVMG